MTSFFFGEDEEPLFGVYTPPYASAARDSAVLFCSPIGIEYQRTHYAIRLVAQQLAKAGFHVLRFDYHSLGDSSGNVDAGQFDRWVEDIELAATELFDISGAQDLTIVGLRMGATLAVEALANRYIKAKSLILWDPIVSGSEYLATLEKMHAEFTTEHREPHQPTDELLGARFPQDMRTAIQRLNIADRMLSVGVLEAALVVSADLSCYSDLHNSMRSRWPAAIFRPMNVPVDWASIKAAYEGRMTGPIIRAVAEAAESLG